ncbi:uncharacterized protein [Pleurodeles waltl]|uniref:uncharacterized protein isoform X1 n=1 Tax=Pleurodeles waltl TaxID=8319 RepID=UPI003709962C
MGSGSSVARRSRGRSSGAAPRSRSPSPGSCSDPCRVHGEEPPVGPRDCLCPRLASGHPPGTEEDDDTDGELDKALAEFEDLCEPRRRQPQTDEGASSGTCDRVPGSSPMLIPSLELEGTAASAAPGRALPSTPLRDREMPSWGQGHCSTSCSQEHHGSRRSTFPDFSDARNDFSNASTNATACSMDIAATNDRGLHRKSDAAVTQLTSRSITTTL